MASLSDLNYTDNMSAAKKPALTDLRESLDSIESYINTTVVDAVLDIAADAWPSGYAFTAAGGGNFSSSNLYDKITATDTYTGGDVTIAATGAWTDVDTTNAAVSITPEHLAGDFKFTFQFNLESVSSNATNETEVRFRLTDGSSNSDAIANVKLVTGVTATTNTVPVTLVTELDSLTADVPTTVKLQYFIVTSTNTTIKVLASTNSPIAMQSEKI